ncbi:hypothetical protein ADICYQ_2295 [Cyclobacterium qasimii M12-11B]|uniref:Uncharacterized protein n=1 Tax=Cyclobacterium qasimii M12-11B TaxID=641524 RepID=S7WQ72_9BACT|nr:hypothetical protein ADICYQ_2295 [Cyclobacterium qasimii M12-11B]
MLDKNTSKQKRNPCGSVNPALIFISGLWLVSFFIHWLKKPV